MAYLLHIDTSADTSSVTLSNSGTPIATRFSGESRNHAASVNLMISDVLATAGVVMKQLAAVVVCAGPGSYTGLRIGMATAKGICYALDIPLIADNRLTLLAYGAARRNGHAMDRYAVLMVARTKEYFITVYDGDFACIVPPMHVEESEVPQYLAGPGRMRLLTDAAGDILQQVDRTNVYVDHLLEIDIAAWSESAFAAFKCNNIVNFSSAEPFYLKQVYTHKQL